MKTTPKAVLAALTLLLLSLQSGHAVNGVQLSIQGNDVHLQWQSQPGEVFIIGYRPTLDPGTPWTFLETAYAAGSSGTETTYVHPDVVVFPPAVPGGGEGGGGGAPPSASSSQSSASYNTMTEEERVARCEELYRKAQAMAKYLTAMLKEAIAKAEADRGGWQKEGRPTSQASLMTAEADENPPPLGSMGFYFVAEYQEDSDGDSLPNWFELDLGSSILRADSDGDDTDDGMEDFDGDGSINFEEYIAGTDPIVDDNVTPAPLFDGLVLEGEQSIQFPADGNNHEGVLCFPDGNLADAIAADEPAPGTLRIRWASVFVPFGGFAAAGEPPPPPHFDFTDEDRRLLREAFGEGGTSTSRGHLQTVNQQAVDQMRRELLEHLEHLSSPRGQEIKILCSGNVLFRVASSERKLRLGF